MKFKQRVHRIIIEFWEYRKIVGESRNTYTLPPYFLGRLTLLQFLAPNSLHTQFHDAHKYSKEI